MGSLEVTSSRKRRRVEPSGREDTVARALALICILNLNGVVTMLTGVGQTFSVVLFVGALYLLMRGLTTALAGPIFWFGTAVTAYLIFANLYYDPTSSVADPLQLNIAYLSSLLLVLAIASYSGRLVDENRQRAFIEFLRNGFVVAGAATLLSPALYSFYAYLPLSSAHRMGGLFGNPNEAAIVSVIAAALLQAYPLRNRLKQAMLLSLVIISVILTLSKTGMTAMIAVLFVTAIWPIKFSKLLVASVLAIASIALIEDPRALIMASAEIFGFALNDSQMNRLLAVPEILGGRVDEQTTTYRTVLWEAILDDSWRRFPAGAGIGSAHYYTGVGGFYENGTWQGAHNVFLMFFAESGPIPLLLLVAALGGVSLRLATVRSSGSRKFEQLNRRPDPRRSALGGGMLICLAVLMVEFMSTHTALTTRYSNVMLGAVFGVAQAAWMGRNRRLAASAINTRANSDSLQVSRDQ